MFEQSNKDLYFLFEDDVDLLGKFDWCAERDKTTVLVMEHTIYNIFYIYHYKLYCLLLKMMLPFWVRLNSIPRINGTFKVSQQLPYQQLYIINATIKKDNAVLFTPVAMALLMKKTKQTYVRFLNWLCERYRKKNIFPADGLEPSKIQSDFECAWISAVETVFPRAKISLCLVHLGEIQWFWHFICLARGLRLCDSFSNDIIEKYEKHLT